MRKRKSRHTKKIPLLGFLVGLACLGYLFYSLKINQVECYSQYGPCPDSITQHLNQLVGLPILRPLPSEIVHRDLSSFAQINSISLYRRLPSVLVVTITLRHPLGALGPSVLGSQVVADDQGYIFQAVPQSTLPLLISPNLPALKSQIDNRQLQALVCLNLTSNLFDTQLYGTLQGTALTIHTPEDLEILIDVAQSTSNWYTPLQLILHRSKINAKMPHKIDLRFSDPVVTY